MEQLVDQIMNNSPRKLIIAGNWKMNTTSTDAVELASVVNQEVGLLTDVSVVLCPPFTALERVASVIEDSNIRLGAQNFHPEASGAYTGEISAAMLRHLFCSFVIVGHSERRSLFRESDDFINQKIRAALDGYLKPILCVGETLEEREGDKTLQVVEQQIGVGLTQVKDVVGDELVIAYEPVWAIGTGKTATPEMAQEIHCAIRKMLGAIFEPGVAARIRILYGGSMRPENAPDLLDQPDIDGGLIGGASLEARSFNRLVQIAHQKAV